MGRGVFQTEWGIPAVTLDSADGVDTRFSSLFGLVRYGVTQNFELRLDSPVYNESRVSVGGRDGRPTAASATSRSAPSGTCSTTTERSPRSLSSPR